MAAQLNQPPMPPPVAPPSMPSGPTGSSLPPSGKGPGTPTRLPQLPQAQGASRAAAAPAPDSLDAYLQQRSRPPLNRATRGSSESAPRPPGQMDLPSQARPPPSPSHVDGGSGHRGHRHGYDPQEDPRREQARQYRHRQHRSASPAGTPGRGVRTPSGIGGNGGLPEGGIQLPPLQQRPVMVDPSIGGNVGGGGAAGGNNAGNTGSIAAARSEANLRRSEQDRAQREKLRAAAGYAQLQSLLQPPAVSDMKEGQSRRGSSPSGQSRRSRGSSRLLRIFG